MAGSLITAILLSIVRFLYPGLMQAMGLVFGVIQAYGLRGCFRWSISHQRLALVMNPGVTPHIVKKKTGATPSVTRT